MNLPAHMYEVCHHYDHRTRKVCGERAVITYTTPNGVERTCEACGHTEYLGAPVKISFTIGDRLGRTLAAGAVTIMEVKEARPCQ